MPILKIENVTKEYRSRGLFKKKVLLAVEDLSLQIEKGEVFALLGPNGAGKTTTMNMVTSIIRPTHGAIELFGQKEIHRRLRLRSRIGYLPESPLLPEYFRIEELLDFYGALFGISPKQRRERIDLVLDKVDLRVNRKKKIRTLSIGQKRALGLAQALINQPEFLILDEPTVYLDPIVINKVRSVLLGLKSKGVTILLASHILSEVEKVSDRVAIIKQGRLLIQGRTAELAKGGSLDKEFLRLIKRYDGRSS